LYLLGIDEFHNCLIRFKLASVVGVCGLLPVETESIGKIFLLAIELILNLLAEFSCDRPYEEERRVLACLGVTRITPSSNNQPKTVATLRLIS